MYADHSTSDSPTYDHIVTVVINVTSLPVFHSEGDSSAAGREGQSWGTQSRQWLCRQSGRDKAEAPLGPDGRPNALKHHAQKDLQLGPG